MTAQRAPAVGAAREEARYRELFDASPIAIREEDWSAVKGVVDRIARREADSGPGSWNGYLARHPEVVREAAGLVRVTAVNRATLALYRCADATTLQALVEAHGAAFAERLAALAGGRAPFVVETEERTGDGAVIVTRTQSTIVSDHRDDWSRVVTTVEDITDRRVAEAAVLRRDAILEAVGFAAARFLRGRTWLEEIQVVIARLGQAAAASRIYIFEHEETLAGALARQTCEWVAPGVSPQIARLQLQAYSFRADGLGHWETEMRLGRYVASHTRDMPARARVGLEAQQIRSILMVPVFAGEQFWGHMGYDQCDRERVWSVPEIDALMTAARILGEVIRRERVEEALRDSEALVRNIIDNLPTAISLKDRELRFRLVNRRFEAWYGRTAAEMLGQTTHALFPKERADIFAAIDRGVRDTGAVAHREVEVPFADGTTHLVEVTKFPVRDGAGRLVGIGGIDTDITEQRNTAQLLRQAQKMEAIGQLTGGVAHDFNNLLAIIQGNLELLGERLGDREKLGDFVAAALRSARRGAELTERLLAFSRRQPLRPEVTDLNRLVSDMTDLLRRTLGETIAIETVLGSGLWPTLVDRGQIENALLNLAINARDAMPAGGRLTIATANDHLDRDDAKRHEDVKVGRYVTLTVTDSGSGMTSEVMERAFEPFYTTKEVGRGSGLGLSMVYGFVKQSGGHVKIYSEVGHGTTVRLYLPQARADAKPAAARPAVDTEPRGAGELVLVVEDDPDVRSLAGLLLGNLGYRVLCAEDGAAGLALLERSPDAALLLTDVVLSGGMSGIELAEEARRRRPALKVLYMSGYTENAAIHNGLLDETVQMIGKPFRKTELARVVRETLERDDRG